MKKTRFHYIKHILMPCFIFSAITGILTGALVFAFKIAAGFVVNLSADIYSFVRANPIWLPVLLLGAAGLGLTVAFLLRLAPECRGGGIPTSIAIVRGLIEFKWLKSLLVLFSSALLSFLAGVPLSNDGPGVQMGTAVGRGTVRLLGKKNMAWDRYIMTGGACAGFAASIGAPLTGLFFAFEEAHRRFSPMLFMVAGISVVSGSMTMHFLCDLAGISPAIFHLHIDAVLPLKEYWIILVIGILCGIFAMLFTKLYSLISNLLREKLERVSNELKLALVFVAVALIGLASSRFIGSGESLIEELVYGHGVWYLLLLYFGVRALLLILSNASGAPGGLFFPTLVLGALLGALCARVCIGFGLVGEEYYTVLLTVGMASFFSASARTPITALHFALEALGAEPNILAITMGVAVSFLVIEIFGVPAFNETVLEARVEEENEGKLARVVDTELTVREGAFAVGKEIRDVLWPPTCVILSVDKSPMHQGGLTGIAAGDVLHVHYRSYDPPLTMKRLEDLVGPQEEGARTSMYERGSSERIPDN